MPMVPQPAWPDFTDPRAGISSSQTDCQNLAAANLDGMDAVDQAVSSSLVSAGAALFDGESEMSAIGDALATSADVAASLDAASLLLDPSPYVDAANSLMDDLGPDLDAAANSMPDIDLTPFSSGAGPTWAGGTQTPIYSPPAGGGDSSFPKIFIPLTITQNSQAFAGATSILIGGVLGTLVAVGLAFYFFNSLFSENFDAEVAQYGETMKAWANTDPLAFAIWDVQQKIADLKTELSQPLSSPVHVQLMAQLAKLQKQLAALQQMRYVTAA